MEVFCFYFYNLALVLQFSTVINGQDVASIQSMLNRMTLSALMTSETTTDQTFEREGVETTVTAVGANAPSTTKTSASPKNQANATTITPAISNATRGNDEDDADITTTAGGSFLDKLSPLKISLSSLNIFSQLPGKLKIIYAVSFVVSLILLTIFGCCSGVFLMVTKKNKKKIEEIGHA
ncbi:unnamed protein product, partial [Mesorhabditis belari]|uniref:Uncharacterized protein n=1 Tax=Mesorhabditis belari TaxID=2138241 RepID=A0AAF3FKH6_9BILA